MSETPGRGVEERRLCALHRDAAGAVAERLAAEAERRGLSAQCDLLAEYAEQGLRRDAADA